MHGSKFCWRTPLAITSITFNPKLTDYFSTRAPSNANFPCVPRFFSYSKPVREVTTPFFSELTLHQMNEPITIFSIYLRFHAWICIHTTMASASKKIWTYIMETVLRIFNKDMNTIHRKRYRHINRFKNISLKDINDLFVTVISTDGTVRNSGTSICTWQSIFLWQ